MGPPADGHPDRLRQRIRPSQGASWDLPQVALEPCIEQDAAGFIQVLFRKLAGREVSAPGMNW